MKALDPHTKTITVLGRKFQIKCPEGQEDELQAAAKFLQHRMHEVYQGNAAAKFDHIAVLAALNIAHELISGENKHASFVDEMGERVVGLREKIRNVLASNGPIDV